MAAVAVPGAPTATGGPFGVMFVVPAFADQVAAGPRRPARRGAPAPALVERRLSTWPSFGAHLRGQPLHFELEDIGARFVDTSPPPTPTGSSRSRLTPPKPGLVRRGPGLGEPIAGEIWKVSPAGLGRFLAGLPAPMGLGPVELADGSWVTGFCCSAEAGAAGTDITRYGGWRGYLGSRAGTPTAAAAG